MGSLCVASRTFLLSALLSWPAKGQFQVIGPRAQVIALVGEEAVLSCHLNPSMDAESMEVKWYRSNPLGLVHHYGDSKVHIEQQEPEYRGRTEFLKENITKGQVALRIHSIRPSDEGEYSCYFKSSTYYDEARFKVLVTVSGTAPQIHLAPGNTEEIHVTCTSKKWYPKPEVEWIDQKGMPLPDTKITDVNGLYSVETSVTVTKSSSRDISCVLRNPVLNAEKEVHVSMAESLFHTYDQWKDILLGALPILAIGVVLALLFHGRKIKGEHKKKYRLLAQEYGKLKEEYGSLQQEHDDLKEKYDKAAKEIDRRKAVGEERLNQVRKYADDVLLDTVTAHPYLQVSDDRKSVESLSEIRSHSGHPEEFDTMWAVLGQNSFSSGNHYWEVEVDGKNRWTIGLCVASIIRKGQYISATPENGFWTLCLWKDVYKALSKPRERLNVTEPPRILGIFLQYERGLITFYNVTDSTILYTFREKFTQILKPYFYPGPRVEGNHKGLSITKVPATDAVSIHCSSAEM